jgi:hypothetical protein
MDFVDVLFGLIFIGIIVSIGGVAVDVVFSDETPSPAPVQVAANNSTNSSTHADLQPSYDYYNMGYWKTRLNS